MTPEQRGRILTLCSRLRSIAAPVGPMHAYWDVIFDMEAFVAGRETQFDKSADEWIKYTEDMLRHDGHDPS